MTFREKSFKETKLPFQIDTFINNMDFQVLHGANNIQLDLKKQKQFGTQKGIYSHRKEQNHYRTFNEVTEVLNYINYAVTNLSDFVRSTNFS